MTEQRTCAWCSATFIARQVNAEFCSSAHRNAFHQACRAWGQREHAAGRVTTEQLRAAASRPVHGS